MTFRCREIQKQLNAFLDQELSLLEQAEMTNHLRGCPACQARFDELTEEHDLLEKFLNQSNTLPELKAGIWKKLSLAPTTGLARLIFTSGAVKRFDHQASQWLDPSPHQLLANGDKIETGSQGHFCLVLGDGSEVWGGAMSLLEIDGSGATIKLCQGEIFANVVKQTSTMTISTPAGQVNVLGTRFTCQVSPSNETVVRLYQGHILFENAWGKRDLFPASMIKVREETPPPEPKPFDSHESIAWLGEAQQELMAGQQNLSRAEQRRFLFPRSKQVRLSLHELAWFVLGATLAGIVLGGLLWWFG